MVVTLNYNRCIGLTDCHIIFISYLQKFWRLEHLHKSRCKTNRQSRETQHLIFQTYGKYVKNQGYAVWRGNCWSDWSRVFFIHYNGPKRAEITPGLYPAQEFLCFEYIRLQFTSFRLISKKIIPYNLNILIVRWNSY